MSLYNEDHIEVGSSLTSHLFTYRRGHPFGVWTLTLEFKISAMYIYIYIERASDTRVRWRRIAACISCTSSAKNLRS